MSFVYVQKHTVLYFWSPLNLPLAVHKNHLNSPLVVDNVRTNETPLSVVGFYSSTSDEISWDRKTRTQAVGYVSVSQATGGGMGRGSDCRGGSESSSVRVKTATHRQVV